jgi:hypothetical protein
MKLITISTTLNTASTHAYGQAKIAFQYATLQVVSHDAFQKRFRMVQRTAQCINGIRNKQQEERNDS